MEQPSPVAQASAPSVPDWLNPSSSPSPASTLTPPVDLSKRRALTRALQDTMFEAMFENFIEQLYQGKSLSSLIKNDHRIVSYEAFTYWIKKDPRRNDRYDEALRWRADLMSGEIIEISDGLNSIDPTSSDSINRDKLRIDARKWIMASHYKKRYGDTKQVEINQSISITAALEAAQSRAGVVDNVIDLPFIDRTKGDE